MKKLFVLIPLIAALFLVTACDEDAQDRAYDKVVDKAKARDPYLPENDVEFNNYNKSQELFDDPSTIIWCSVLPQANTSPIITIPVAGKLTSSTTSYFSSINGSGYPARSVDGLYHPNPPKYRYGFTPGGQYIDFFGLPTLCTTQPLSFQKESVEVSVDKGLNSATKQASDALKSGDKAKAQQLLEAAAGQ